MNEPVAYRYFDKDIGWLYHDWKKGFTTKGVIPLYTHPVKELTDEEINKIYFEKYDGHMGFLSPDEVREFARAILRKAQEK